MMVDMPLNKETKYRLDSSVKFMVLSLSIFMATSIPSNSSAKHKSMNFQTESFFTVYYDVTVQ